MARRADALKRLIAGSRKTADQTQKSFLKAEDVLSTLEDREHRRAGRSDDRMVERFPAIGGDR